VRTAVAIGRCGQPTGDDMNLQRLLSILSEYMPSARVTTDESGELVIHTGMCVDSGYLVELTLEEV